MVNWSLGGKQVAIFFYVLMNSEGSYCIRPLTERGALLSQHKSGVASVLRGINVSMPVLFTENTEVSVKNTFPSSLLVMLITISLFFFLLTVHLDTSKLSQLVLRWCCVLETSVIV